MKKVFTALLLVCLTFGYLVSSGQSEGVSSSSEPYVFYVYKDYMSIENCYEDIWYMGVQNNGNDSSMTITPDLVYPRDSTQFANDPADTYIEITYQPTNSKHWAGMYWLSGQSSDTTEKVDPKKPPEPGADVTRAKKLTFLAKGAGNAKFFIENNTGNQAAKTVPLTPDWAKYTIDIPSHWDMVCIGFGWAANYSDAKGSTLIIDLDEIRYEE